MAQLPRRQREVLALRYYLDLSEREIAETLGISAGAVKSHASRGADALRRSLSPTARGVLMTGPTTPNDGDLRALLDDAVSDVHPEGGPEQIRARRPSALGDTLGADHVGRRGRDGGGDRWRVLAGPAPALEQPSCRWKSRGTGVGGAGRTGSHCRHHGLLRRRHGRWPPTVSRGAPGEGRDGQRRAGGGRRGTVGTSERPGLPVGLAAARYDGEGHHGREPDHRGPHAPRDPGQARAGCGRASPAGTRVERRRRRGEGPARAVHRRRSARRPARCRRQRPDAEEQRRLGAVPRPDRHPCPGRDGPGASSP